MPRLQGSALVEVLKMAPLLHSHPASWTFYRLNHVRALFTINRPVLTLLGSRIMNHLLNEDILYLIFQFVIESAEEQPMTPRMQREELFSFSLVSQMWSRIAQSLLFRSIFLQTRTSLMAFLSAIPVSTERGQRLARCVRVLKVRLSRDPEAYDPPPLPLIHTRHIPGLLAHLPTLHSLEITMGAEDFTALQLAAIMQVGRSIRVLNVTILPSYKSDFLQPSIQYMFRPPSQEIWSSVQSLTLVVPTWSPNGVRVITTADLEGYAPPKFSISHIEIFGAKIHDASELCWLLSNSHSTLRHVTLRTEQRIEILIDILSPHRARLQHLTLYFLCWTDAVVDLLHQFPALRELRILHSLNLTDDFPGRLPGWLEHFTFPITQLSSRDNNRGRLTMDIPTRLKTCTYIVADRVSLAVKGRWVEQYRATCEMMGVKVEMVDADTFRVKGSVYPPTIRPTFHLNASPTLEDFTVPPPKIPIPKIRAATEVNSVPESLLDLTDYATVYSHLPPPVDCTQKTPPQAPSLASRTMSWLFGRV